MAPVSLPTGPGRPLFASVICPGKRPFSFVPMQSEAFKKRGTEFLVEFRISFTVALVRE